jgi:hypothetical protein
MKKNGIFESYFELMQGFVKAGFCFCHFSEINEKLQYNMPFLVLRHDIDIDLRSALEIARIENEMGIKSTYFISLRTPFYNALSNHNHKILEEIYKLGHDVATHVECEEDNKFSGVIKDINTLKQFNIFLNSEIASLHSPGNLKRFANNDITLPKEAENVYGAILRGELEYISDSTGQWRYGHPYKTKAFQNRKPMQLLIHPIWWTRERSNSPEEHITKWFSDRCISVSVAEKEFLPQLLLNKTKV